MKLKDFKFCDQSAKTDVVRSKKLIKKIDHCLKYLVNHLPVNKLTKKNTFNFDKLKFDEGKNYDWYFLNNKNTTILVRQYGNHFTFFVRCDINEYHNKTSVFTITDNREKMEDDLSDSYCDDPFQNITNYLPDLVEMIENDKVHSLWNDYSFKVPKFTDIKIAMSARESISSLDTLFFACDELFNIYICTHAENEVLEQVKTYKVGDLFGSSYVITRVETELGDDPYYHGVGLEYTNNNFPDSKATWSDVYSLAMYHSEDLDHENVVIENEVMDFIYKNNAKVMKELTEGEQQPYMWMHITYLYIEKMCELYPKEMDLKTFSKCVSEEYRDFIEMSYRISQSN